MLTLECLHKLGFSFILPHISHQVFRSPHIKLIKNVTIYNLLLLKLDLGPGTEASSDFNPAAENVRTLETIKVEVNELSVKVHLQSTSLM